MCSVTGRAECAPLQDGLHPRAVGQVGEGVYQRELPVKTTAKCAVFDLELKRIYNQGYLTSLKHLHNFHTFLTLLKQVIKKKTIIFGVLLEDAHNSFQLIVCK